MDLPSYDASAPHVQARARVFVPHAGAPAYTTSHAAALAPMLLRAPRVAVPGLVAQRARECRVIRSAH